MRHFMIYTFTLTTMLHLTTLVHCQNGPSPPPKVSLAWTQSTTAGVTNNGIYRGSITSGSCSTTSLTVPAIASPAATTSYTDTTPPSGTDCYGVTAQIVASGQPTAESAYSNVISVSVPIIPTAPTGLGGTVTARNWGKNRFEDAKLLLWQQPDGKWKHRVPPGFTPLYTEDGKMLGIQLVALNDQFNLHVAGLSEQWSGKITK